MPLFVDTNVFVYARNSTERVKSARALEWTAYCWATGEGRVSFQVLQELYATLTRKLSIGLSAQQARAEVRTLFAWDPVRVDIDMLEAAWKLEARYSLSFWDALIVAAAKAAGCDRLLTEDLQHDQNLEGVLVVNPFHTAPGAATT